jgi:hypothetical protein
MSATYGKGGRARKALTPLSPARFKEFGGTDTGI